MIHTEYMEFDFIAPSTGVPIGRNLKNRELPYTLYNDGKCNQYYCSEIHEFLNLVLHTLKKGQKKCKPNASLSIHAVYHVHFYVRHSDSSIIIEIVQ